MEGLDLGTDMGWTIVYGCVHSLEIIVQLNNFAFTSSEPGVLENLPVVFET